MKNRMYCLAGLVILTLTSSCIRDFLSDEIGGNCKGLPEADHSVADVHALYEGTTREVTEDWTIEGYVISSDKDGNFFGSLHFQDHPSDPEYGLQLEIDLPDAHLWYPPGTKILVKLKGLYLGKRKGVLTLGGAFPAFGNLSVGRLPAALVPGHIIASCDELVDIVPVATDAINLGSRPANTLVSIAGLQLVEEEAGLPFAEKDKETERNLQDCDDNRMLLQNSAYSDFATEAMPGGRGMLTAVYVPENSRSILRIRSLDDMLFGDERCLDGSVPDDTESGEGAPGDIESGDDPPGDSEEPSQEGSVLITELADPDNNPDARFLELYNAGDQPISLDGWTIRRYTNANTEAGAITDLSGLSIAATGFLLLSPDAAEFQAIYGLAADLEVASNSAADSNGDDNIELVNPDGEVVDVFGRVGDDGSGTDHEFEDGRAVRILSIVRGNSIYDPGEWEVYNDTGAAGTVQQPQQAPQDFNPGER
ncbi:MAG: lamin tail domain-containing protein [Flavobacteriaceae bacterium]|nr:lamin tail domain-containing protein [Flavobacteriaceae bacterium]